MDTQNRLQRGCCQESPQCTVCPQPYRSLFGQDHSDFEALILASVLWPLASPVVEDDPVDEVRLDEGDEDAEDGERADPERPRLDADEDTDGEAAADGEGEVEHHLPANRGDGWEGMPGMLERSLCAVGRGVGWEVCACVVGWVWDRKYVNSEVSQIGNVDVDVDVDVESLYFEVRKIPQGDILHLLSRPRLRFQFAKTPHFVVCACVPLCVCVRACERVGHVPSTRSWSNVISHTG